MLLIAQVSPAHLHTVRPIHCRPPGQLVGKLYNAVVTESSPKQIELNAAGCFACS